jgi:hypothetical protein
MKNYRGIETLIRLLQHEINNPLTVITMSMSSLMSKCQKNVYDQEVYLKALKKIESHSDKIANYLKHFSLVFASVPDKSFSSSMEEMLTLFAELIEHRWVANQVSFMASKPTSTLLCKGSSSYHARISYELCSLALSLFSAEEVTGEKKITTKWDQRTSHYRWSWTFEHPKDYTQEELITLHVTDIKKLCADIGGDFSVIYQDGSYLFNLFISIQIGQLEKASA